MADYAKYEPILEMAKAAGFSRAEVFVCTSEAFSVSAHKGKAEDLRVERRSGVALRGLLGGQMGYAATEAEGEAAYAELVRAAAENAALLESQDEQFLYDGDEKLAWVSAVDESLLAVSPERKIALALEMERLGPDRFLSSMQIGYLAECRPGEELLLWTREQDGTHFVQGMDEGGKSRFEAALIFGEVLP